MLDPIDPTEPAPWDIIRVSMVIGPVTGYFHQYYTMYKMKTSMGFSSVTCGVLIVSSIIRIFFWIGEPFDTALLYQSILMTIVQLFLLELCVRYYPWTVQLPVPVTHSIPSSRLHDRVGSPALGNSSNAGSGSSPQGGSGGVNIVTSRASRQGTGWYREHAIYWGAHFWNWPTIGPYFLFLAVFTLVIGLSLLIIGNTPFYVALLGLAALGIEATVPLPQAIQNYRSKSTAGFSPAILLMWVIGDSFKTYYYISTHAKYQFVGCGIIQLCIDCVIIIQTVIYSKYWKDASRHKGGVFAGLSSRLSKGNGGGRIHSDAVGGNNSARRNSSEALLAGGDEDDD
ncbi:hypothetical protein BG015_004907 [Linnemannia schmuckeri]|uniref:PQ-loop repeat-containing protein 1 n=1 Tax=Linnemannia schmuckeri TaxID=64567 RepID=A0A9P5S1G2_9FUNG|nr:hypothetical protein BG015_004907 [Linnemannia schmuckeri]